MPAETMPYASAIPEIDLGSYLAGEPGALDRAAAELRHALTEIGFYTIVNHGVPSALVHEVHRQVARFHARPAALALEVAVGEQFGGAIREHREPPTAARPAASSCAGDERREWRVWGIKSGSRRQG
jgi:isopenicillin N synthase-like dioxygenase